MSKSIKIFIGVAVLAIAVSLGIGFYLLFRGGPIPATVNPTPNTVVGKSSGESQTNFATYVNGIAIGDIGRQTISGKIYPQEFGAIYKNDTMDTWYVNPSDVYLELVATTSGATVMASSTFAFYVGTTTSDTITAGTTYVWANNLGGFASSSKIMSGATIDSSIGTKVATTSFNGAGYNADEVVAVPPGTNLYFFLVSNGTAIQQNAGTNETASSTKRGFDVRYWLEYTWRNIDK